MDSTVLTAVHDEDGNVRLLQGTGENMKEVIRSDNAGGDLYWKDVVTRLGFIVTNVFTFTETENTVNGE